MPASQRSKVKGNFLPHPCTGIWNDRARIQFASKPVRLETSSLAFQPILARIATGTRAAGSMRRAGTGPARRTVPGNSIRLRAGPRRLVHGLHPPQLPGAASRSRRIGTGRAFAPPSPVLNPRRPCLILDSDKLRELHPAHPAAFELVEHPLPAGCRSLHAPQRVGFQNHGIGRSRIHHCTDATTFMTSLNSGAGRDAYRQITE